MTTSQLNGDVCKPVSRATVASQLRHKVSDGPVVPYTMAALILTVYTVICAESNICSAYTFQLTETLVLMDLMEHDISLLTFEQVRPLTLGTRYT
jgi:hypothetical protein